MFNLFKRSIHDETISYIENRIKELPSFKYFLRNNSSLLIEYKKFEISVIASAIYKNYYFHNQGKSKFNEVNEEIKKIYFKKISPFIRDKILTGKLFLNYSETYSESIESVVILRLYVKFNEYCDSIKDCFIDELPYWVEEFQVPDYDEDLDMNISGVKHYYSFILNILLSEIKENDDNQKYINTLNTWEIDDDAFDQLKSFVFELKSIKN